MTDNIRGIYFLAMNLRAALRAGDATRAMRSLVMEGLAGGSPNREHTRECTESARRLAEQLGTPYAHAMIACAEGGAAYFWGDWARAAPKLLESEMLLRERCLAVTFELNSIRMMLLRTLAFLGRMREMGERLPDLVRDAEQREDKYALVLLRTVGNVTVALARDDEDLARGELERAERHLTATGYHIQHYLCAYARGTIDLYAGRADEVCAQGAQVWKSLRRVMLTRVEIIRVLTLDLRARSAVAAAARRPAGQERDRLLADAARWASALEGEIPAWSHALASVVRAGVAGAQGDRTAALAKLEVAQAAVEGAAMRPHALAVKHRIAAARSDDAAMRDAEESMKAQGIAAPLRWVEALVPGF
jgi:hypothetical protein